MDLDPKIKFMKYGTSMILAGSIMSFLGSIISIYDVSIIVHSSWILKWRKIFQTIGDLTTFAGALVLFLSTEV